jgi:hypothetical protein
MTALRQKNIECVCECVRADALSSYLQLICDEFSMCSVFNELK